MESGNSKSLKIIPKSNLKTKKKSHQTKKTLNLEIWHLIRTHKKPLRLKSDSPPLPPAHSREGRATRHPQRGRQRQRCLLDEGFTQLLLQLRSLGLRFLSLILCRFGWCFFCDDSCCFRNTHLEHDEFFENTLVVSFKKKQTERVFKGCLLRHWQFEIKKKQTCPQRPKS